MERTIHHVEAELADARRQTERVLAGDRHPDEPEARALYERFRALVVEYHGMLAVLERELEALRPYWQPGEMHRDAVRRAHEAGDEHAVALAAQAREVSGGWLPLRDVGLGGSA